MSLAIAPPPTAPALRPMHPDDAFAAPMFLHTLVTDLQCARDSASVFAEMFPDFAPGEMADLKARIAELTSEAARLQAIAASGYAPINHQPTGRG